MQDTVLAPKMESSTSYTCHTFSETWTANINRREEEVCCSWDFRNREELCWCSENDSRGKLHFIPFSDALMPKLDCSMTDPADLVFLVFFFFPFFLFLFINSISLKDCKYHQMTSQGSLSILRYNYINNLIIKIIINHDQY